MERKAGIVTVQFETNIFLQLTEGEAAALDAIAGYGAKGFLEVFKKHMGKSYIEPYEQHVPSLFEKAHGLLSTVRRMQEVRQKYRELVAEPEPIRVLGITAKEGEQS